MSIMNVWYYSKTSFDWAKFANMTRNQYRVVCTKPYIDKNGILGDGITLTLTILYDDARYGTDKNGQPRGDNQYQTFSATVLTRAHNPQRGDIIQLLDFDNEHSFVIRFDTVLRFRDMVILQPAQAQDGEPNA